MKALKDLTTKIFSFACATIVFASSAPAFAEGSLEDMLIQSGIPEAAVHEALQNLQRPEIVNRDFMAIVDLTKPSDYPRFHLVDLRNSTVQHLMVAHGKASGAGKWVERVSNQPDAEMSSSGAYVTKGTYMGARTRLASPGMRLTLAGLEESNSNAESRRIVLHGAPYVHDGANAGHSHGCFALDYRIYLRVISELEQGGLIYAYYPSATDRTTRANPTEIF